MDKTNIKYRITELVEDAYKFNYDADFSKIEDSLLQIRFEHSISFSQEKENLTFSMKIHILNGSEELVLQGVRASFQVIPFNSFVNFTEKGSLNVSNQRLIDTFISVCIGAARGMLAKNLKGTQLDGVVLPLVPMNFIRENALRK